ncbi:MULTISPECIES: hypothetical protein [Furfurilactobacillus]|uniref:Uncharacterized protein n=1 Tax=Furfurilactobacillus rossiae TaxID=231049 RepID=A0A7C9MYS6_9LACO|nr:hypothetical protein [Furfurilactobacillus milii]MYV06127.1 hypothetical protein [Furfurilactobacillus milii]
MPLSEAQKKAQKKYNDSHKDHRRYLSYRNTMRTFLRNYATDADLEEVKELLTERHQINRIMDNLDAVRALISEPNFTVKTKATVSIWRRPADMMKNKQENEHLTNAQIQQWFDTHNGATFNPETPIVEIHFNHHVHLYDALHAYDIVEWLVNSAK